MFDGITLSSILLSLLMISVFLVAIEFFTIRLNIPRTHSRKIVHVGSALLIILVALLFGWRLFLVLGPLFIVVLGLARLIHPLESLRDRANESFGELLFPLGVTCAALICQAELPFIITMLILGISDTVAFYVGRSFKSRTLLYKKSLAGSCPFLVTAFVFGLFLGQFPLAALLAIATTIAELISPKGTDNLSIPIVASLLLTML